MGLCLGKSSGFKLNDKRGQDKMAARFFDMIGLEKYDVHCFYSIFAEIDLKETGLINIEDFFIKYRLTKNDFLTRLFNAGINERKSKLNFTDLITVLWNFLSMDEGFLSSLVYYLYDNDGNDSLEFGEIKRAVESIHQKSYDTNASIRGMIDFMQYSYAQISRDQFAKFCKKNHNICSPIISMQFNMRKKIIGDIFWNKVSNKRMTRRAMCKPEYVYECLEDCEALRGRLAREARLAEFQEMKKSMLSEQMSQVEKDKEAKQSKRKKVEEKSEEVGAEVIAETEAETEAAKETEGEKPKVFSSKLKRSISTKMMAVKGFKDGIKVSPSTDDVGGEVGKLIRRSSSRQLSISDNDDDRRQSTPIRRSSTKALLGSDDEGGGPVKRSNSRKSISSSDDDGGGGGGGAKLRRNGSRKSINVGNKDNEVQGKLKRSSSRKLGAGSDDGGAKIKRSGSRKFIATHDVHPAGGDGRQKLEPINLSATNVKLEPLKKKSKKSSRKHKSSATT